MSYVLDALKRADAERERGGVPGLHAQPVSLLPDEADKPRTAVPWLWLGAGLAIGLLGAFAWLLSDREPARAPVAAAAAPAAAHVVPAADPPAMPAPPATPPLSSAAISPAAPAAPPEPVAPPAVATPSTKLPAVAVNRGAARPAEAPASTATEQPVVALKDLPEALRRELPTITVGGSVYSSEPTQRFLMINGQVVHEKDEIAPGLRLEQIKLKSAVLRYKDVRYSIDF